jgi:hypothetical protein
VVADGPLAGLCLTKPSTVAPESALPAGFNTQQRIIYSRHSATLAGRESGARGGVKKVTFASKPAPVPSTTPSQAQLGAAVQTIIEGMIVRGELMRGTATSTQAVPATHVLHTHAPSIAPSLSSMTPTATAVHHQIVKNFKGHVTGIGSPEKIAGELDDFIMFAVNNGVGTEKEITQAVFYAMSLCFAGKAREWLHMQHSTGVTWGSLANMAADFKSHFCTEVRFAKQDARYQLIAGKVKMGKGTLQEYTSKFKAVVLRAVDLSITDKIFWFLNGLTPELHDRCLTDQYGQPWESLDALVTWAHGQELALHAKSLYTSNTRAAQAAPVTTSSQHNRNKRTREDSSKAGTSSDKPATKRDPAKPRPAKIFKGNPDDKANMYPHLTIRELQERYNNNRCFYCGDKTHGRDREGNIIVCPFKANPK